jgi:hypothetical protein
MCLDAHRRRRGTALASAQVWVTFPEHRHTSRMVITNAQGEFRIDGLPPEDAVLTASRIGLIPERVEIDLRKGVRVRLALRPSALRIQY